MTNSSLMAFVDCRQLARQLELRGSVERLPATVDCIRCDQHTLRLLSDGQYGGIWSYCASCGFAGDIIELAAARWKTDIDQAASLVVDEHYAATLYHLVQLYLEQQQRRMTVRAVWQRCVDTIKTANTIQSSLLTSLNIHVSRHVQWDIAAAPLVGLGSVDTIRQLADALGVPVPRTATADHWVIQPTGTLPGQLEGFIATSQRKATISISQKQMPAKMTMAAGLVANHSGTILALDDPWVTLSLQLQHLRTHRTLLPLICLLEANPRVVEQLQQSQGCRVAIGTIAQSVSAAAAAAGAAGGLAAGPVDISGVYARSAPATIVQRAIQGSVPIARYVTTHVAQIQPDDIRDIVLSVTDIRSRVAICRIPHPHVTAAVSACEQADRANQITIHDSQLWLRGVMIANGVPVINQVIWTGSRKTSSYIGEVRFADRTVPFSTVGKRSMDLLRQISHSVPDLYYQERHTHRIFTFVQQMFPPTRIRGVSRVGWNQARQEMQFPRFTIATSGEISVATPVSNLPAIAQLSTTLAISRQIEPLLVDTHAAKVGWLAASYIAHSMLSAFRQQPATCIASLGSNFIHMMRRAGCLDRRARTNNDWPAFLPTHMYHSDRSLLDRVSLPTFIHADSVTGRVLATQNWTLVDTGDNNLPDSIGIAATAMAVQFICDEIQANRPPSMPTLYETYTQLKAWTRKHAIVPNVNHLSGILKSLTGRNPWLGALLLIQYAIDNNLLQPTTFSGGVEIQDGILNVPQRQLEAAASQLGFAPLSIDQVTENFRTAAGFKGIRQEPGQEYWLLDHTWFKESTT